MNTTLCYIEKDGKYLMLHRVKKKNDVNHDKYVGVGGKFEQGESPEECAVREIFEETGLCVHHLDFRGIITFCLPPNETEYMHLFTTSDFSGELKECDEGNLEWISKNEVKNLPIWQGDKIFFDLLDKNEPFFSLKLTYQNDTLTSATLNGEKMV